MAQAVVAGIIVAVAAAYAAWVLMPAAWRRAIARRLGRPPPAGGCEGCCHAAGHRAGLPAAPGTIRRRRR